MLIRLDKAQAMLNWHLIEAALRESAPIYYRDTDDFKLSVMDAISKDYLQVWFMAEYFSEEGQIYTNVEAIGITTITQDPIVGKFFLMLYAVKGSFNGTNQHLWKNALDTLKKFAKDNKLSGVIGYIGSREMSFIARQMGAEITNFAYIPV